MTTASAGLSRFREIIGLPLGSFYAGLLLCCASFCVAQIILFGIGYGSAASIRSAMSLGLWCGGVLGFIHGLRRYPGIRMSIIGVPVAAACLSVHIVNSLWRDRLLLMEAGNLLSHPVLITLVVYLGCSAFTGYFVPGLAEGLTRPVLWDRIDPDVKL